MPAVHPCMVYSTDDNECGFDCITVGDWNDPTPPLCFQVKVKSKEASDDLNYPVPVLGITPVQCRN